MSTEAPIRRAVESVGGNNKIARIIGVHPSLVSQWINGTRPVAAHQCRPIESACNGVVTRYQLRPDVFGDGHDD